MRRVAITGASGLVGGALVRALSADGVGIVRIGRGADADVRWDAARDALDPAVFDGVDAVVNLAGAPIAQRWTRARKLAIRDTRIRGTNALAHAIAAAPRRPTVLVSGSGIGVYGDRGNEVLTESSGFGSDFLATVAREWEDATQPAERAGVRVVRMRTGVALARDGGALAKLLLLFRLGLGGPVGGGRQWMSWIGLHDLVRAIRFAITSDMRGPMNAAAPNPVTNAGFGRALGSVLHRPAVVPTPAFALRLVFGEMAVTTILASQRAHPAALEGAGFVFDEPSVEGALRRELRLPKPQRRAAEGAENSR